MKTSSIVPRFLMKRLLGITLVAAVVTMSLAMPTLGQTPAYTYHEIISLITNLHAQKVVTSNTVSGAIGHIVQGLIDHHSSGGTIKRNLFLRVKASVLKKEFKAADPEHGELLRLLYYSKQEVPYFITDRNLKSRVPKKGKSLRARIARNMGSKNIVSRLHLLEDYNPQDAAALVEVIAQPWYSRSKSWGDDIDPNPSWASTSLWTIYHQARLAELAKRSVLIRLLTEEGLVPLPDSVDAYFTWSGMPNITIDLRFVHWTDKDRPELERLLTNSRYSAFAQRQLDRMNSPSPL